MRFYLSGPRIFGIRPGVLFNPRDFRARTRQKRTETSALSEPAFVYVVMSSHQRCKIGITNNPNARLAQLNTASAFPVGFAYIGAAQSGNGRAIESEAQAMLERYRANGEWFDCPAEMAIAAVNGAAIRIGEGLCPVDRSRVDEIISRAIAEERKPSRMRLWLVFLAVVAYMIYMKYFSQ